MGTVPIFGHRRAVVQSAAEGATARGHRNDWPKKPTSTPLMRNRQMGIGASTIERWYYKARDAEDPIAALGRKIRSDAGIRWSMSDCCWQNLKAQYQAHRRWNVQLHYDNLVVLAEEQTRAKADCPATRPCYAACVTTGGAKAMSRPSRSPGQQTEPPNGSNAGKCAALKSPTSTAFGIWTFTRRKSASWTRRANGTAPWRLPFSTIAQGCAVTCSSTWQKPPSVWSTA